jgi:Ca2+/Na+ antiporter
VRRKAVTKPANKTPAKSAKKKETTTAAIRPARELPASGGVAGTVASAAPASPEAASLPSALVSSTPESDGGIAATSIVFSAAILLGLALLTLAAIPNRQLAALPASRWIAMRRLDLVIGGTAAIIGVLAALVISEVMGP